MEDYGMDDTQNEEIVRELIVPDALRFGDQIFVVKRMLLSVRLGADLCLWKHMAD